MNLRRMGCAIQQKTFERIREGAGANFADWNFAGINGKVVKGSELAGLDGCDIRRKLGWADISCKCPEHNQRFLLLDEDTGEPLNDAYYEIRSETGDFVTGKTDSSGYTDKIHAQHEEEVEIKVFVKEQ